MIDDGVLRSDKWRALRRHGPVAVAILPCVVAGAILAGRAATSRSTAEETFVSTLARGLFAIAPLAAAILVVSIVVAVAGARLSRRPAIPGAVGAGALFLLTLSPSTPVISAALAWAFGLIVGREIFGHEDRTFVHSAVLGHVFLLVAWPQALGDAATYAGLEAGSNVSAHLWLSPRAALLGASSLAAVAFAGVVFVATGRAAWRPILAVPVGAALALALLSSAGSTLAPPRTIAEHFVVGGLSFGAVFFAGMRGSSPTLPSAQWFHGFLIGALVVLLRLTVPSAPDGTMSAILIASIFAPLVDRAVQAGRAGRAKRVARLKQTGAAHG